MSSIASEAGALRHGAQLAQGPRNVPSADGADPASPFSALLDEASVPPAPGSTTLLPTGQKAAPPAQDGAARPREAAASARPAAAETSSSPPKPSPDNPAPQAQTVPAANGQKAVDVGATAPVALVDRAGKGENDTDADVPSAAILSDPTAVNVSVDPNAARSTAVPTDRRGDKGTKSDASTSDVTAAATPAPAAGQQAPMTQPGAVALALAPIAPAPPPASDANQNGGGSGDLAGFDGTAPDPGQLAGLGDVLQSGRGRTDRANAPLPSGSDAAGTATGDSGATPGAKTINARPPPLPPPSEKTPVLPSGQDQSTPNDTSQPRTTTTDAISARQATASHARQLAASGDASDTDAAPGADPSPGPGADSNNAASSRDAFVNPPLADLTRQALDTLARHVERPETAAAPPAASGQAGDAAHAPGDAAVAPALLSIPTAATAASVAHAGPPAVPVAGIAVEISAQAQAGRNRFDIRLDPPELGRIDVRLDVDRDGKVTSHLIVDRLETLDLLRRDASEIERSLQQAGLKTADNNALQFSLRDNGTSGGFSNFGGYNPYPNDGSPAGTTRLIIPDRDLSPVDAAAGHGRAGSVGGGIDIRV